MNTLYTTSLSTKIKVICLVLILYNIGLVCYFIGKYDTFVSIATALLLIPFFGASIIFLNNKNPLLLTDKGVVISLSSSFNLFTSVYFWKNIQGIVKEKKTGELCLLYTDKNKGKTDQYVRIPFLWIKEPKEHILSVLRTEFKRRGRLLTDESQK